MHKGREVCSPSHAFHVCTRKCGEAPEQSHTAKYKLQMNEYILTKWSWLKYINRRPPRCAPLSGCSLGWTVSLINNEHRPPSVSETAERLRETAARVHSSFNMFSCYSSHVLAKFGTLPQTRKSVFKLAWGGFCLFFLKRVNAQKGRWKQLWRISCDVANV